MVTYSTAEDVNILKNDAFKIEIISLPKVVMFAQTVDLPGMILGEALRPNPLVDYMLPGDKVDFENFMVNFMVDEQLENYQSVMRWMFGLGYPRHTQEFINLQDGNTYDETSDIKVQLTTNKNNYFSEITLVNAFPISLSAVQLSYNEVEPSHPTASVEFQYQYFYYGNRSNDFFGDFV